MILRIIILSLFTGTISFCQNDSLAQMKLSAYGELYYSYDFSNPQKYERPDFLYNHKRHNEITANLIMAKASYAGRQIRSNLGLMAGTYPQYNLANEPDWAKFIYEANIGFKISNRLWLDAGIMPSHIGFESAISADCWTLTRSILAENSPYFETGVKVSYSAKNEKFYLAALLLNGWQNVQKAATVPNPSFGLQATFKPSSNITINYSNFSGSVPNNTTVAFRHFHNFYLINQLTKNTGIIFGFDIGYQKVSNKTQVWYTPVVILRHYFNNKWSSAFRGEYYNDRQNIIFNPGNNAKFIVSGMSWNADYDVNSKVKIRVEAKNYFSEDRIFNQNTNKNNLCITSSLSIKL